MQALPPSLTAEEQVTGLTCPDCYGALSVCSEGSRDQLHFRCRIGHAYSTAEVIEGKERRIEELAWAMVTALEELVGVLSELNTRELAGRCADGFAERAERAKRQGELLKRVIAENAPTVVGVAADPVPDPASGGE